MVSIVDNLKDGLKYPLYESKKILIIAIMFIISIITSFCSFYVFFSSLRDVLKIYENSAVAHYGAVFNSTQVFSMIPTVNYAEAIILVIVSVVLSLFITAYMYKIIKSTVNGENTLPDFGNLGQSLINAIKVIIVGIVYQIVPAIIAMIGFTLQTNSSPIISIIGWVIIILDCILAIFLSLMEIMAINNMAGNEDNLKSAFDFKLVKSLIDSIGWLRYLGSIIFILIANRILIICAAMVSVIICVILAFAGPIGLNVGLVITVILMGIVSSYIFMVQSRYYGSLYIEAVDK